MLGKKIQFYSLGESNGNPSYSGDSTHESHDFSYLSGDDDDVFAEGNEFGFPSRSGEYDFSTKKNEDKTIRNFSLSASHCKSKQKNIRHRFASSASAFDSPFCDVEAPSEREDGFQVDDRHDTDIAYASKKAFGNVLLLSRQSSSLGNRTQPTFSSPAPLSYQAVNADNQNQFVKFASLGLVDRILEYLNSFKVDINAVASNGMTALHSAVMSGNLQCAELLIQNGANCEIENSEGNLPLHVACQGNWYKLVSSLLVGGAKINTRNRSRQTPLHIAVRENCKETVDLLLRRGAITTIQDKEGNTPLHLAITNRSDAITSALLDHGDSSLTLANNNGFNALQDASRHGYIEGVHMILKSLIKGYSSDSTAPSATPQGSKRWVIDEPKQDGMTALHLAMGNGYSEIVALLLKYGAKSVNAQIKETMETPLCLAIAKEEYEAATTFLRCCPAEMLNLDLKNNLGEDTALHLAMKAFNNCRKKRKDSLRFLKNKKDFDEESDGVEDFDDDKSSGLDTDAAAVKALEQSGYLALLLIKRGASLNIANGAGRLPLDYCRDAKFEEICRKISKENKIRRPSTRRKSSNTERHLSNAGDTPTPSVAAVKESDESYGKTRHVSSSSTLRKEPIRQRNSVKSTSAEGFQPRLSKTTSDANVVSPTPGSPRVPVPPKVERTLSNTLSKRHPSNSSNQRRLPSTGHEMPRKSIADVLQQSPLPTPLLPYMTPQSPSSPVTTTSPRRPNRKTSSSFNGTSPRDQEQRDSNDVFRFQMMVKELQCPMCNERQRRIVFVTCGHYFCQVCSDRTAKCPQCGIEVSPSQRIELQA